MTLSQQIHDAWLSDGFVKVPNFLSRQEVTELQGWVDEISSWPSSDDKWMHHFEQTTFDVRLSRSEYLLSYHEGLRLLLTEGSIPNAAGELLGESVVLYKEKINYKYPGGGGYAPHQDAPAYEFVNKHITCSIAIDPATSENGCLIFSGGLHDRGLLKTNADGCLDSEFAAGLDWIEIPMEPGDALFFSSYAPHKSGPNQTDHPRRSLYLTYNSAAEGDLREAYYQDKRQAFQESQNAGNDSPRISKIAHFQGKPVKSRE